jgi:hypothetical protein
LQTPASAAYRLKRLAAYHRCSSRIGNLRPPLGGLPGEQYSFYDDGVGPEGTPIENYWAVAGMIAACGLPTKNPDSKLLA